LQVVSGTLLVINHTTVCQRVNRLDIYAEAFSNLMQSSFLHETPDVLIAKSWLYSHYNSSEENSNH
jgi:hypothetical protein